MTEELKDYQVLDVLCGGTFYKVRHKVTNNIFAWRAHNCSAYSDEEIQKLINEVKIVSKVLIMNLQRHYDTILHSPSKTLYFVLEYNCWRSVEDLIVKCKATEKRIIEKFVWYLLLKLAYVCKSIKHLNFAVLRKSITKDAIFVDENGKIRVNCFSLSSSGNEDLMRDIGEVVHELCYQSSTLDNKHHELHYSNDLRDIVSLLTDNRGTSLRPDVLLYHPTVLANSENVDGSLRLEHILIPVKCSHSKSDVNKCDSEKAVELRMAVEPAPRTQLTVQESPIYSNVSPKRKGMTLIAQQRLSRNSMSPTLAALALELPGFVPRTRRPITQSETGNCPHRVSEETLSQQWMTRLIALREREESLNRRERDIIAKEIVSSPCTKMITVDTSRDVLCMAGSNGITLPPLISQVNTEAQLAARRRPRRPSSTRARGRRKSYGYEDLDSSLSADAGDSSIIITATKFTKENMPRRNIFPDISTKKVHFTPSNPFVESDESVTLTFYELDNVNTEGYQVPRIEEKSVKDITKFKYLDLERSTSEKRAAKQWTHSSPSKQAKVGNSVFTDITNRGVRKTPFKTSITLRGSNVSCSTTASDKSTGSMESSNNKLASATYNKTRSSTRQSLAHTPSVATENKKSRRKSLLPFKTPFKFMTSTKI